MSAQRHGRPAEVRYVFRSVWHVAAPPADAYDVLYDLGSYPRWWKEVKEAVELSHGFFDLRCRSFLPYDLRFTSRQKVADPDRMVLESALEGDLEGYSRWTITGDEAGAALAFDEEVVTNKEWLNRLAPIARPAFKANHYLMMRHGEAGLRMYLAGYLKAKQR